MRIAAHTMDAKALRMKFLCIIFGCPGGGKGHIIFFAMPLHSKKAPPAETRPVCLSTPRGTLAAPRRDSVLVLEKREERGGVLFVIFRPDAIYHTMFLWEVMNRFGT